jgi:polar amino acid transport system ATP-binding protein
MAVVRLSKVSKAYGAHQVLREVSFELEQGRMLALIGRSGSGKSTLLRCMNGLETIQGGEIEMAGHRIAQDQASLRALRQDVGIVFQQYNLFPHLTVERNVTLAPGVVKGIARDEARALARRVLAQVGLESKIDAYPDQLSGGQQQRVAIARSLAMAPKVMLFDEVTSALDPELTGEVLKVMEDLARGGMTMILVTHEMAFARRVADTVGFMHHGRLWEFGTPEQVMNKPATPELEGFLGAVL